MKAPEVSPHDPVTKGLQTNTPILTAVSNQERTQLKRAHKVGHFSAIVTSWILKQEGVVLPYKVAPEWINKCSVCAQCRVPYGNNQLGVLSCSKRPKNVVRADILGPLDTRGGQPKYLLTVVDYFSRLHEVFPIKTTRSKDIVRALGQWTTRYGRLWPWIMDCSSGFIFENTVETLNPSKILWVAPNAHKRNGLVERYNRTLITRARKMCLAEHLPWSVVLRKAINLMKMMANRITGIAP